MLLPYLSAQSNIEAALVTGGMGTENVASEALSCWPKSAWPTRSRRLPSELSGGQRQAVALVRALANHPRLLLADEPTGALDSASGKRALDLLATTRERHGMTVIVVSHDDAVAERADRVVHLVDGQVG